MTHARLLSRLILAVALATGAVMPSHAGPADAVTVTDFSSASSLEGWTWTQSTKTLRTISNYSDDWLYQESYFNLADITGGQSVSITGNLLLDYNGDGDFVLELIKSGTLVATGAFSFFDFAGGPKTVTSPLTFNDPSVRTINAWIIYGNGNPWEYECEITFTDMFVSVPEPSTCFSLAAALAFGGWHVLNGSRKRTTSAARGAIVALLVALCSVMNGTAHAINYEMVTVGDPGNAADVTGYGAVGSEYRIGKYEVTIQQYTDFLNAVAASDPYSLYNSNMATDLNIAGIWREGSSGSYTYRVITDGIDTGNRPITYVSWFDAARFTNWMQNGQLTGTAGVASTETGAYTLNGATSGAGPMKNAGATWWLPSENEWYKAAYYKGGGANGGYWVFPTQSDSFPGNTIGGAANQANYYFGSYSVTQSTVIIPSNLLNYLTDAGAFSNSGSAYGTFDQGGSVFEWNDDGSGSIPARGVRGGSWYHNPYHAHSFLESSYRPINLPVDYEINYVGFRIASVPEPSTYGMGVAGLAWGGYSMLRRRRRA